MPGDDEQVIYVWWDALGNYITALEYGNDAADYQNWWVEWRTAHPPVGQRCGAVPRGLLAGDAVVGRPAAADRSRWFTTTSLWTAGRSASPGYQVDPVDLVTRYGIDAVRWWLVREVPAPATSTSPWTSSSPVRTVIWPTISATWSTGW